ncbi:hypothetical protein DL96DRAFT_1707726 [Flagelloscypha sp. PMI_526]|nr:hypothetical protein DL96DRAFT_1707726 [Flagelloscypha sp. PMI_526]
MSACKSFPTDTKTAVVASTTVHTFTSWSMSTIVPSASCTHLVFAANSLTSIPHLYESTAVVDSTFTTTLYGSSCSRDPSHPTADSGASDGNAHSTLIVTRTETIIGRPVQSSLGGLRTSTFHSGAVTLTEYEPTLQTASSAGALSHSSESYLGRIIGSVVGAVSGIVLIGCLFYYCSRRKQTGLSSEQVSVLAEAGAFQKRGSSEPKPYDYGRVGSPPLTTAVSPLEYPASVIHSHHHSGDDPGDYFAPSLARSSTLTSHATFLAPERSLVSFSLGSLSKWIIVELTSVESSGIRDF